VAQPPTLVLGPWPCTKHDGGNKSFSSSSDKSSSRSKVRAWRNPRHGSSGRSRARSTTAATRASRPVGQKLVSFEGSRVAQPPTLVLGPQPCTKMHDGGNKNFSSSSDRSSSRSWVGARRNLRHWSSEPRKPCTKMHGCGCKSFWSWSDRSSSRSRGCARRDPRFGFGALHLQTLLLLYNVNHYVINATHRILEVRGHPVRGPQKSRHCGRLLEIGCEPLQPNCGSIRMRVRAVRVD